MRALVPTAAAAVFASALAFEGDGDALVRETAAITRPATLPFLWRALLESMQRGDARSTFHRAKELLAATPGWTDGHAVFAFRFALDGGDRMLPEKARVEDAFDRLQLALHLLEESAHSGDRRAATSLADAAWLLELAVRDEPGLAAEVARRTGEDPALRIDRYLARAESLGAGRMVREQRLNDAPRLCAAFLRAGDRARALALLAEAAERCLEQQDEALREEWRGLLLAARTALATEAGSGGQPGGDADLLALRARLAADPRLQPLAPFLR